MKTENHFFDIPIYHVTCLIKPLNLFIPNVSFMFKNIFSTIPGQPSQFTPLRLKITKLLDFTCKFNHFTFQWLLCKGSGYAKYYFAHVLYSSLIFRTFDVVTKLITLVSLMPEPKQTLPWFSTKIWIFSPLRTTSGALSIVSERLNIP